MTPDDPTRPAQDEAYTCPRCEHSAPVHTSARLWDGGTCAACERDGQQPACGLTRGQVIDAKYPTPTHRPARGTTPQEGHQ